MASEPPDLQEYPVIVYKLYYMLFDLSKCYSALFRLRGEKTKLYQALSFCYRHKKPDTFSVCIRFFTFLYSVSRQGLYPQVLQRFPHFPDCIGIHIFFNLIDDCPAVHIRHFCFTLIHVDKTYKAENADGKPYVEASAGVCRRFFRIFIEILVYSAISGMNGRDIFFSS